ncbi:hypothetical protein F4778DRAFT_470119 [Xylariomycetidae sp. FL2044]|nr:hypothetical protein F4778DRAFT_470119 [Xylariomycetidae sp. FL2044]
MVPPGEAGSSSSPSPPPPPRSTGGGGGENANSNTTSAGEEISRMTTMLSGRNNGSGSGRLSGIQVYEAYYSQPVNRVLKPFFFASIGFSIPISKMFDGSVVWRGVIYSILMMLGKMLCGAWLVRFRVVSGSNSVWTRTLGFFSSRYGMMVARIRQRKSSASNTTTGGTTPPPPPTSSAGTTTETQQPSSTSDQDPPRQETSNQESTTAAKPLSLYPSAIMAFAMVARGEIGFLISAVAETKGIFRRPGEEEGASSELFLIVTWAIVLCTIIGPLGVGILVKRVKKLERASAAANGDSKRDVLGAWGVR